MSKVNLGLNPSSQSYVNINSLAQQFLSNGSAYYESSEHVDSFTGWNYPEHLKAERALEDVRFLDELAVRYEKFGPENWYGQTVPIFTPINAEVGDDHIHMSDCPLLFLAELVSAEDTFCVKVSEKDTFMSERYGNYSENYILKPDNISEIHHPNMKSGEDTVYLDIVKIRTVLPVCSTRQKHSDTVDGKVSLLGKQALYKTELCGFEVIVGQNLQQLNLGLMKERRFPYVPTFLGGYGSPPIFDNVNSMIRSFESYKHGTYYNVLAAISLAVFEAKNRGKVSAKKLLTTVKGHAESWQNWYKVYTKYTPSIRGNLSPELYSEEFYLGTLGKNEIWDSAANRLLSAGVICSKTQLLVHDHMEDLTNILLSPFCSLETREIIELEKKIQRQESLFNSNLLRRVDFDLPLFLEDELVDSLLDLSRSGNYHLKAMLQSDDLFTKDALDSIKQRSPTIVSMQMQTRKGLRYPLQFDMNIRDDEIEYYNSLYEFIRGEIGLNEVSRVLVEDDPILIEIAKEWAIEMSLKPLSVISVMVITTDDTELCATINRLTPTIVVVRISPKRKEEEISRIKESLESVYKNIADIRYFDDEGSIANAKASTAYVSVKSEWQKVKFHLGRKIDPFKKSQRRLNEVRVTGIILKPDGIFDQQGLLSQRYNKPVVSFKRSLSKFGLIDEYERLVEE